MLDSVLDRTLVFRLATAYDCWGHRRHVARGARNGLWFIHAADFDAQEPVVEAADHDGERQQTLDRFIESGAFTTIEIATLRALVIERLTIGEIAERDGCSRQAVVARLIGNSRGQGGIVKKAAALRATFALAHSE